MCGPFRSLLGVLRLLEIILSALALVIPLFRGRMTNPYGVWCEFVWLFCLVVPIALTVIDSKVLWKIAIAILLPNWDDFTCGLSMLCALMLTLATLIYAVIFGCLTCVGSVLCVIFSLAATLVFLVDAVMAKITCPLGYLSHLGGVLRFSEAVVACIILAGATNYFLGVESHFLPPGMVWCIVVYAVCFLVTVAIILLNLLKVLQCLLSFGLGVMETAFNVVAVSLYVSAVIVWPVFGYKHYKTHNPPDCQHCRHDDLDVVMAGSVVNLVLYSVDLVLSIMARFKS